MSCHKNGVPLFKIIYSLYSKSKNGNFELRCISKVLIVIHSTEHKPVCRRNIKQNLNICIARRTWTMMGNYIDQNNRAYYCKFQLCSWIFNYIKYLHLKTSVRIWDTSQYMQADIHALKHVYVLRQKKKTLRVCVKCFIPSF